MVPLVIMGVGAAMQMASGYMKNMSEAAQGYANANWLKEQAEYAKYSMFRELKRTEQEYSVKMSEQLSNYAASGIDSAEGSAAYTVGTTAAMMFQELKAVRYKGSMEYKLAMSRSNLTRANADSQASAGTNIMQGAGTLINSYTNTNGFGAGIGGGGTIGSTSSAPTAGVSTSGGFTVPTQHFGTLGD